MPTKDYEIDIPQIPIRIRKEGEWLKLKIGRYQLKVKDQGNQEYDFVTVEQFITNSAKLIYQNIVQLEQVKKDLKAADDWDKANKK
jgi:hypothetical protein